ncbi:cytoskeletal protein Sojo-like [Paramacrobiotus metropolitanus]|uniref:cytoskeletal protein Sojo-like n=1 Tax=Paramacrobiotus metropolitanus TaxID=2943436 RepID=UPI002445CF8F|nr:cytoskeletal protein Sojo-like [Paramacrobiotus metropolitanus]
MEEMYKNSVPSSSSKWSASSPFRSPVSYHTRRNRQNQEESPLTFGTPARPPKFNHESMQSAAAIASALKDGYASMPSIPFALIEENRSSPMNRIQHQLKQAHGRIGLLERELTELEQQYDEKGNELEKCRAELKENSVRLRETTSSRDAFKRCTEELSQRTGELEKNKEALESKLAELEEKCRKEKNALSRQIQHLASVNQQLQTDFDKQTETLKRGKEKQKAMSATMESLQKGLDALSAEGYKLKDEKAFLENSVINSRAVFDAKEATLREEMERLRDELNSANHCLLHLGNTLALQKMELESAVAELSESREAQQHLEESLAAKSEECGVIQDLISTLQSKCDKADQELMELQNLRNELTEKDKLLLSVKEEVLVNKKNFSDVRGNLAALNEELATRDKELEELHQLNEVLTSNLSEKSALFDEIQASYAEKNAAHEEMQIKYAESLAEADELAKQVDMIKGNTEAEMKHSAGWKEQLDLLSKQKTDLELKYKVLEERYDHKISTLTDTILQQINEKDCLREKLSRAQDQIAALMTLTMKPEVTDRGTQYVNEAYNDDDSFSIPIFDNTSTQLPPSPLPSVQGSDWPRTALSAFPPAVEADSDMVSTIIPISITVPNPVMNSPVLLAKNSPNGFVPKEPVSLPPFRYNQSAADRRRELEQRNAKFAPHLRSFYPGEATLLHPEMDSESPDSTSYDSLSSIPSL